MNKELKRKWVEALLSGEYEQGEAALVDDGKYCCLGVLGKVIGRDDAEMESCGFLAVHVLDAQIQRALAKTNDAGVPFDMIAGLIDEAL